MTNVHDDWDGHWKDYAGSAEKNPSQKYRRHLIFRSLDLSRSGCGVRLLDIGSGQGDFAKEARGSYPRAEIMGLELSQGGVDVSIHKVPDAIFIRRNLLEPAKQADYPQWATHAVCSEVLEHVGDPRELLANAREYMAPGCRLVVTVPGGPMSAFEKHIGHRQHYTPGRLRRLLEESGFEVMSTIGAGFPFFNLYKCAGYLRGERLIDDVRMGTNGQPASQLAIVAMSMFDVLFWFNLAASPWGWQIVGKARLK